MRRTAAFLSAGLLGVVALLSGLSLDAYLHARDPSLAHREGIFTLSNPGHVLLGIGIGLVVVGVVGAAYTSLPYGVWLRRGLLASALALLVVSGDIAGWAASVERSGLTSSATTNHNHTSAALERQPTATELAAAAKLVADTKASVARYASLNAAIAAGYKPMEPTGDQVVHYVNPSYLTVSGIAVAFMDDPGSNANEKSGSCPRGSTHKTTPQMLHVWLIDNPDGPFASTMAPDVLGTTAAVT